MKIQEFTNYGEIIKELSDFEMLLDLSLEQAHMDNATFESCLKELDEITDKICKAIHSNPTSFAEREMFIEYEISGCICCDWGNGEGGCTLPYGDCPGNGGY